MGAPDTPHPFDAGPRSEDRPDRQNGPVRLQEQVRVCHSREWEDRWTVLDALYRPPIAVIALTAAVICYLLDALVEWICHALSSE
jgi:hypothetical protein